MSLTESSQQLILGELRSPGHLTKRMENLNKSSNYLCVLLFGCAIITMRSISVCKSTKQGEN